MCFVRFFVWALFVGLALLPSPCADAAQAAFPIGAVGGRVTAEVDSRVLVVSYLRAGGAGAQAGLRVDDQITGVYGQAFVPFHESPVRREGPLEMLGAAIDHAQGSGGELVLNVRRGDRDIEIAVGLRDHDSFADSYPYDCRKSQIIYEALCERLAQRLEARQIRGGKVTLSLASMALLGHQTGRYDEVVAGYVDELTEHYRSNDVAGNNVWLLYHDGVLMCEYYLIAPNDELKAAIERLAVGLSENIPAHGRYGHGLKPEGIAYDGQGLNATTSGVLWFFASAARCGIEPSGFATGFEKCFSRIHQETNANGGVGYAWGGDHQSSLRSGQAGLAMHHLMLVDSVVDRNDPAMRRYDQQVGTWASRHPHAMLEAHAVSSIGITASLAGLCAHDREAYAEVMQQWRWWFALAWEPAGDVAQGSSRDRGNELPAWWVGYVGGKGNVGGDYYLNGHRDLHDPDTENFIMEATVAFILAASHERLSFYGGFPAIPGVNYNLLTDGQLRRGYQLMRAKRHVDAMRVFQTIIERAEPEDEDERQALRDDTDEILDQRPDLALAARGDGQREAPSPEDLEAARILYDYIETEVVAPAYAELEAVFESGDVFQADEQSRAFLREYGRLNEVRGRVEALIETHLESREQRREIALGRRYYRLEESALRRPIKYRENVEAFIEENRGTFYGQLAEQLLIEVQALDTPAARADEAAREQLNRQLVD